MCSILYSSNSSVIRLIAQRRSGPGYNHIIAVWWGGGKRHQKRFQPPRIDIIYHSTPTPIPPKNSMTTPLRLRIPPDLLYVTCKISIIRIWWTFRVYLVDFWLNIDFSSQFCVFFTIKSPSVTQTSVSQENAFKKSKNPSPFFPRKIIGSNNSFTLIENHFRFLR